MKISSIVFLLLIAVSLSSCSKPKAGICSKCPFWWIDPICLTGGDVPDSDAPKPKTPPPVEANLIPGQENSTFKRD